MKRMTQGSLERKLIRWTSAEPQARFSYVYKQIKSFATSRGKDNRLRPVVDTGYGQNANFTTGMRDILSRLGLSFEEGNDHERKISIGNYILITTELVPSKSQTQNVKIHGHHLGCAIIDDMKNEDVAAEDKYLEATGKR